MQASDLLSNAIYQEGTSRAAAMGALTVVAILAERVGWVGEDVQVVEGDCIGMDFHRSDGTTFWVDIAFDEDRVRLTGSVPSPIDGQDRLTLPDLRSVMEYVQRQPLHETFGARLAAARRAKNLSQVDLAEILGVTQATVSRWEANRGEPTEANRLVLRGAGLPSD